VKKIVLGAWFALAALLAGAGFVQCAEEDRIDEPVKYKDFYIAPRPNYANGRWLFETDTHKLLGYAVWDESNRRFNLFDLRGNYGGFYQASVESLYDRFYRQYLKYDDKNKYTYAITVQPGGRPVTEKNPYGELGGGWVINQEGNMILPEVAPKPAASPLEKIDNLYHNY
jgi:hypothetical protein